MKFDTEIQVKEIGELEMRFVWRHSGNWINFTGMLKRNPIIGGKVFALTNVA